MFWFYALPDGTVRGPFDSHEAARERLWPAMLRAESIGACFQAVDISHARRLVARYTWPQRKEVAA